MSAETNHGQNGGESGSGGRQADAFTFSEENAERARAIIAKYPAGRQASAVMPLLDLAQRQSGGWLPEPAMRHVADVLDMPLIRVWEVATFYTMYNLEPIGRHHVQVCTNLPCLLRGAEEIMRTCRETVGAAEGATSEDSLFTLSEVECLGACVNAPMMQIGDDYYEDLSPESTRAILETLRRGETPKPGSQVGRRSCEPITGLTTLKTHHDSKGAVKNQAEGKG